MQQHGLFLYHDGPNHLGLWHAVSLVSRQQHGLTSIMMALITSDCGMQSLWFTGSKHGLTSIMMALITSDCDLMAQPVDDGQGNTVDENHSPCTKHGLSSTTMALITSDCDHKVDYNKCDPVLMASYTEGGRSRRRDCHSAAPPSPFSGRFQ